MRSLAVAGMTCLLTWALFQSAPTLDAATSVRIYDNRIEPALLSAKKGQTVHLTIVNSGKRTHNFVIPAFYIFTQNLVPGERTTVRFDPDKTGSFPYYSDTGGKPEPGIRGTMRVN